MSAPANKVSPGRLMDLATFIVAFSAFGEFAQGMDNPEVARHIAAGMRILKKRQEELAEGISEYIYTLTDLNIRGVKGTINRHKRIKGKLSSHIPATADLMSTVFGWLNQRTQIRDQVFPGGKVRTVLTDLVRASAEDGLDARIHRLAKIVTVSGMNRSRQWIQKAAQIAGKPLTEMESMEVDAATGNELGKKIGNAKRRARLEEPNSPEAVEYEEEAAALERAVEGTADRSRNPGVVRLMSAQASAVEEYPQSTKMGQQIGLSRDQERALLVKGKAIIAAGAGSGKTRVLAGKVVHHVRDEGVPMDSIIATSFSKKSAGELKKRIKAYGADPGSAKNIGTTHSLGMSILQQYDPGFSGKDVISGGDASKLVRMAMSQVRMSPQSASANTTPPDPNESIFLDIKAKGGAGVETDPDVVEDSWDEYRDAMMGALSYWQWMADKGYGVGRSYTDVRRLIGYKAEDVVSFLSFIREQRFLPPDLDDRRKEMLNAVLAVSKAFGEQINYRVASKGVGHGYRKMLAAELRSERHRFMASVPKEIRADEEFIAAFEDALSSEDLFAARAAASKGGGNSSNAWYKTSADQWFNLGWPTVQVTGADKDGNPKIQKIGPKRFSTAFSKYIGDTQSVGQCFGQHIQGVKINKGKPFKDPKKGLKNGEEPPPFDALATAVYGAYNWLKGNAVEFAGRVDFSDMLVRSTAIMIHNPDTLGALKSRYSHILVDEAQDLNQLQHLMFGLIAGYVDPATEEPYGDGRLNAEVYALIGDDKQAIYAFRGADPEEFIRRSDMGDEKGEFKTTLLETNYRSGGMIVGAANNLIKHNKVTDPETGVMRDLQIPMTCNVLQSSEGQGVVEAVPVSSPSAAAEECANTIQNMLESGEYDLGPDGESPTFGIALRTNAEAYNYAAALVRRGIPFRSTVDVFGNQTTKAVLQCLQLSSSTNVNEINDAVLDLWKAPNLMLGAAFQKELKKLAQGNYYDWLTANWTSLTGGDDPGSFKYRALKQYVSNLVKIRETMSNMEPENFLEEVFRLEGFNENFGTTTFKESLMEYIRQNEEEMDSLSEESSDDTGKVDDGAIEDKAMAPVQILRDALDAHGDIANALTYISKLQELNSKTRKRDTGGGSNDPAVLIGTCHGWKGLECEHLFTQMAEGMFPSAFAKDEYKVAQERRLAYVAITRGKESVTVYSPEMSDNNRPMRQSRFISEACIPGLASNNEAGPDEDRFKRSHEIEKLAHLYWSPAGVE